MNWAYTANNKAIKLQDIPEWPVDDFRSAMIAESANEKRVIGFFGVPMKNQQVKLYGILADDENSRLMLASTLFLKEKSYPAITPQAAAFHLFERELYEELGILPENHPWLKPVRFSHVRYNPQLNIKDYPFFSMEGIDLHEVGVGPIHAGVIEPGHFRFSCYGEEIYNLEIQLGYQHRGVIPLLLNQLKKPSYHPALIESAAGDSVIAHATCFAQVLESLSNHSVAKKPLIIRALALELERIGIHLGDLSALSNDVAYLTGSAVFGALRTLVINTTLAITGSRFGRNLIRPGGVIQDIDGILKQQIKKILTKVQKDAELGCNVLFSTSSVLSRFENTGIVDRDLAKKIGLVGPAARASGLSLDIRNDHPFGIYNLLPIHKITMAKGDVLSRAYIRYVEIKQSFTVIQELLDMLDDSPLNDPFAVNLNKNSLTVSLVEGWRGETVHTALTDQQGKIFYYKIKDPSFNNWTGLELAVRNIGISDFPLCNKSFNLSYCGYDL